VEHYPLDPEICIQMHVIATNVPHSLSKPAKPRLEETGKVPRLDTALEKVGGLVSFQNTAVVLVSVASG
jgi:hypothetical protein